MNSFQAHSTWWRNRFTRFAIILVLALVGCVGGAPAADAASLSLTPNTGVYSVGQTFTARVVVNTDGETINAADGTFSVTSGGLEIVAVNSGNSIFNLWTEEPTVSNGAVSFSGGAPSGYSGRSGTLFTVTMRASSAGSKRVQWQSGSVLAADGRGTNVLSGMNGSTYTVSAPQASPEPEVIEYVPEANTPAAPNLSSPTHPDAEAWYQATEATVSWSVPAGVTAVRTAVNQDPRAVPGEVADSVISELSVADLPDGESYAHVQFQNEDGWGTIARYRLAVSTEAPRNVSAELLPEADLTQPTQDLVITVGSSTAPVTEALVQIDGGEPESFAISGASSTITLPTLEAGYHTLAVEVQDAAGNGSVVTLSFTITAFAAPEFASVPNEILDSTIPVFRGTTRPGATVTVTLRSLGNDTVRTYEVTSDADGVFTAIPERSLPVGVYELTAVAADSSGAVSESSTAARFVVQQPGYLAVGGFVINILSTFVTLLALVLLLVGLGWYGWYYLHRLRRRVRRESSEAHTMLQNEFGTLRETLDEQTTTLAGSRKSKQLTKAEQQLVDAVREQLAESEARVEKEIADVEAIVPKRKK